MESKQLGETPESNKLALFNHSVAGRVLDIKETSPNEGDLIKERTVSFKFYDKKQYCQATVTFVTDKPNVDLYAKALRFVKRLTYK